MNRCTFATSALFHGQVQVTNKNEIGLSRNKCKWNPVYLFDNRQCITNTISIRHLHSENSSFSSQDVSQSKLPVYLFAEKYLEKTAIVDNLGSFTYADLLHHSLNLAFDILSVIDSEKFQESNRGNIPIDLKLDTPRIALLTDSNVSYVIGQFATWLVNGISVPLCSSHPPAEWEYFLEDSQCSLVLASDSFVEKLNPAAEKLNIPISCMKRNQFDTTYGKNRWFQSDHATNKLQARKSFLQRKKRWFDHPHEFILKNPALIVYTSGTTGPPKGVVLTHGNIMAMIKGMVKSWEWTSQDSVLHVLPLHHVHGIINVLLTPLACGATCVMEPKFDAGKVWNILTSQGTSGPYQNINLFMAVPTIYAKLIQYYDKHFVIEGSSLATEFIQKTLSSKLRLMVSGSAALPDPINQRWKDISGHQLLERYGMTEIGMALTNPLHGNRIPGAVGKPFPSVEVCISKLNVYSPRGYDVIAEGNSQHTVVTPGCEEQQGDLLVRGPSVFPQYWNRPEVTAQSFTKDGWFKTGDTAVYKDGAYRIVGRTSVDVIKSGGYKISALDVERHLLAHPDIQDCAIVGLPDITWGQKIAAVLVLKENKSMILKDLQDWARDYLPPYQLPTIMTCLESMPRNAMGKVNKKELINQVFPEAIKKK